jgi:hypothetical protein
MSKLPDDSAFGGLPSASSGRPVASYDVTGYARGAAAIAKGAQDIGKGLSSAGQDVASVAVDRAKDDDALDYAKARSAYLTGTGALDNEHADDQDYATLEKRYGERLTKVQNDAAALIRNPKLKEKFSLEMTPDIERQRGRVQARVRSLEGSANRAWADEQGDKFIDQAVATDDPDKRRELIDGHNTLIDRLAAKGFYNPEQALAVKQAFVRRYATADLTGLIGRDPQAAVNRLRAAPGSPAALTGRIMENEGAGKDPGSSAVGGFINSTWLDLVKRERPDLAKGHSDDDLLAMRADQGLRRDMTEAYRRGNEAFLRRKGIEATPGAQYLAHFLGPGAAAAVLTADPKMPVADALAQAVGKDQADRMIVANPSILGGKLVGSVTQWADGKMGGAAGGSAGIYDLLPPDQRAQMLARAEGQLHKRNADDLSTFRQRFEDTSAEAMRTGGVTNPLGLSDFVGALGAEVGPRKFKDYQGLLRLGTDLQTVAALGPGAQARLLESYQPKPGSEGYAAADKRYKELSAAIVENNQKRKVDPAAFAIARLPVVNEAYAKFASVVNDPAAAPEARQAAARDLAAKMDMEQARIGVPAEQRRIVPESYVDTFNAMLTRPDAAGGTLNVAAAIEREAQLWGDRWPDVYREIAKGAQPVVRVIGSGVKPHAAQILAETAKIPLNDILKDQDTEKFATVKKDVLAAFKPLAASMAGSEGAIKTFNDFRGEGEKLAAYHVMQGMSSSDAAVKAFDDLVGFKYDFSGGSYRVPKDIPVSPEAIAAGARAAKAKLGDLGIAPARDTIGGLSPDYLKTATASAYARDGVWVTAPDESGLALIYKDQAVRRADGKPLILSWAQLNDLGKQDAEAQARRAKRQTLTIGAEPARMTANPRFTDRTAVGGIEP